MASLNTKSGTEEGAFYVKHMSVWDQGASAARAGKPFSSNPHPPLQYDFVSWGNGWLFAKHQMAKEDLEEL